MDGSREEVIVDAARRLVRRNGHPQVTIEAVAREADVAKGTVYLYFANKAGLVDAVATKFLQLLRDDVSGAADARDRWIRRVRASSAEALLVASRTVDPASTCHRVLRELAGALGLSDHLPVYALIGSSLALLQGSSSTEFESIWSALFPADDEWLGVPEPGWTPIRLPDSILRHGFMSGGIDRGIRIRCYSVGGVLHAKVLLGPAQPPGHAHRGSIASVLDDVMGAAVWVSGRAVVAVDLRVFFHRMLPLGTRCIAQASVGTNEGPRIPTRGSLSSDDGMVFAEAEATFVMMDAERVGETRYDTLEGVGRRDHLR